MEVVGEFEFGNLGLLGSGAFAAVFKGRHVVVRAFICFDRSLLTLSFVLCYDTSRL
jgi:hypothetical protein